jgi:EAL domain-containing protein (putative c-di-GMP-specific phosphodiesterase class I)
MQSQISAMAILEESLRHAIKAEEFILHYQPQVNAAGDIIGAEGLVRWLNPEKGLLLPADFIPVAESSKLILPIGQQVLDIACRQLTLWNRHPQTRHLTLAVNVSARQFHHAGFVAAVRDSLSANKANPNLLKLELTESLLLEDIERCVAKMSALRDLGVELSLDDFGTGYSSLTYLKRLPLSQLKIDKSFVHDLLYNQNDATIVRTIIILAKSFGLRVIAEGVEQQEQWDFLVEQGCDEGQGYLFGRPNLVAEFPVDARFPANRR